MKVSSERIPDSQVVLNVELEPDEVEDCLKKSYKRLVKKVDIPGFRKGKTPRSVLERQLGKPAFLDDAINNEIPNIYNKVINEQEIDAIDQPQIEVIQIDPIIFKATIPVRPTIELGDYSRIQVEPEKIEVTEDQINGVIEQLRLIHASWEPVDRKTEWNDLLTIDITGTNDGKVLLEDKGRQYQLLPDSGIPIKGFSEQIIGLNKGQNKSFTLTFPADYQMAELAGKECLFNINVSEIKEKHLPDLDDEFAKTVNADSVDILRVKIKDDLTDKNELQSRRKLEEDVMQTIIDITKIEYPPILKDREVERLIEEQRNQLISASVTLEDYLKHINKTVDELKKELEPIAIKQIKGSLILDKVAEQEEIKVIDEDIEAEIERISPAEKNEEFRKFFHTAIGRSSLERTLLSRKTIQHLVDIATGGNRKEKAVEVINKEAKDNAK